MEIQVPISKVDEDRRMAFGWANVFLRTDGDEVVDSHNETIDTPEAIAMIEDAVYRYMLHSRSGDEQHVNFGVARVVESMVFNDEKLEAIARHSAALDEADDVDGRLAALKAIIPTGWWIGMKIDDPDAWRLVKDGTYSMFSIVGTARRVPIDA
ncbi:MAG: hypothetical protein DRQ39_09090 [Gammaproteobacteria bacterium]|nr:MAG: hypothetical protein DRQ39_09090 [Gammaproteobacteria bacterium]